MQLFEALLELADDHLILGHRLSEWCGHAPMLEEDLALPNMALDLIGTARTLYAYAGEVEGKGRSEDDLAYFRDERSYRNCLLVERHNGDFAHTMLRQLYFAGFMVSYWTAAQDTPDAVLRGVAGKALKEMRYHVRHAGEWVIRLGDGTRESAGRMGAASDALMPYTEELFLSSAAADGCEKAGVLPVRKDLRAAWTQIITPIFEAANLAAPEQRFALSGGRDGLHGEELGHLLAEMQSVARAHPGAQW